MAGFGLILAVALQGLAAPDPGPGAAAPAPVAAAAAAAAEKPAEPKKVCVVEAQLGSHFKKRICATPEDWERRRLRDAEAMARQGGKTPACTGTNC